MKDQEDISFPHFCKRVRAKVKGADKDELYAMWSWGCDVACAIKLLKLIAKKKPKRKVVKRG